jgi:hypothetical protein
MNSAKDDNDYESDDLNEEFVINSSKRSMIKSDQNRIQSSTGGGISGRAESDEQ